MMKNKIIFKSNNNCNLNNKFLIINKNSNNLKILINFLTLVKIIIKRI
jgi:hypothetical protein